jgi:hypothetical protein
MAGRQRRRAREARAVDDQRPAPPRPRGGALRLAEEAPTDDVEAYLQERLGYETPKTLAKYLDEYNWFEAVGREQLRGSSQ